MDIWRASHFFDFTDREESEWDSIFAEFAKNQAEFLTVNTALLKLMLKDKQLVNTFIELGKKYNIKFFDIHGLCGKGYDLNTVGEAERKNMFQEHSRAFEIAQQLGARNYVMHIGAWCCVENCWYGQEAFLRSLAVESLEKLLPEAEKYGVTIAIENAFEPSNTPDELLIYLRKISSAALGVCFDAGHATMMSDTMVKRDRDENNDYERKIAWHGRLEFQHNALEQLSPYIVTCHLHDNDGYNDQHKLIFSGVANWEKYAEELRNCPRLKSVQNEIKSGAVSIAEMCQAFDRLKTLIEGK